MNLHPLPEVAATTGLSLSFVRKCLNRMPEVFKKYRHQGLNNAIQLEDSALVIFQQISDLKAQGYNLPTIMKEFAKSGLPGTDKPVSKPAQTVQTEGNPTEPNIALEFYEKLDQERKRTLEEKEARMQIQFDLYALKTGLKLLTDGKTDDVEKARAGINHRRLKRAEIIGKLETLSFWQASKRKKLLTELKSLDHAETTIQTDT